MSRRDFLESGIGTCYLFALTLEGKPCYVQWIVGPKDNDAFQERVHGIYPRLKPDEVMFEAVYTFESFRRQGIMSCAMAQILPRRRRARAPAT